MIHKLQFTIAIQAEKPIIWKALWDDASYRDWASVFFEGSYMVCENLTEGSTVQFLGPDKNGIYSLIDQYIPDELIRFKHMGSVINGEDQPIDDDTKVWSGATEQYALSEGEGHTVLQVDIDVMDEHLDYMNTTFPKALEKIKANCAG